MMRASWMFFEVGMAVSRSGLLWIYNCPATNITPANATANIALANLGARHRNESAARESTIGSESSPGARPSPRPEPAPATALDSARAIVGDARKARARHRSRAIGGIA